MALAVALTVLASATMVAPADAARWQLPGHLRTLQVEVGTGSAASGPTKVLLGPWSTTSHRQLRRVAEVIDGLRPLPSGVFHPALYNCPADFGVSAWLWFTAGTRHVIHDELIVETAGCSSVRIVQPPHVAVLGDGGEVTGVLASVFHHSIPRMAPGGTTN